MSLAPFLRSSVMSLFPFLDMNRLNWFPSTRVLIILHQCRDVLWRCWPLRLLFCSAFTPVAEIPSWQSQDFLKDYEIQFYIVYNTMSVSLGSFQEFVIKFTEIYLSHTFVHHIYVWFVYRIDVIYQLEQINDHWSKVSWKDNQKHKCASN